MSTIGFQGRLFLSFRKRLTLGRQNAQAMLSCRPSVFLQRIRASPSQTLSVSHSRQIFRCCLRIRWRLCNLWRVVDLNLNQVEVEDVTCSRSRSAELLSSRARCDAATLALQLLAGQQNRSLQQQQNASRRKRVHKRHSSVRRFLNQLKK